LNLKDRTNKKIKQINILIIRVSSTGKLGISKPCIHCLIDMNTLPQRKGYIIKNIFYSDYCGNIVKTTLKQLLNSDNYYVSKYFREHNYKPKLK
jgi:hypothetical protein